MNMKRNIILVTLMALLLTAGSHLMAQQAKFGHVDYTGVAQSTPEWAAAEAEIKQYGEELQAEGEALQAELQKKYEEYQSKQATYSEAVAKLKQQEIQDMYQRLQKFSADAEKQISDKQTELLEPIQAKVLAAIKEVAKENKYTYVFDISTQLFNSESDDLTDKVKAKLGIK